MSCTSHAGSAPVSPTLGGCLLAASLALLASGASAQGNRQGPVQADVFHPATLGAEEPLEPAFGGRVIMHLPTMPPSLNFAIDNSTYTRRMHFEIHEYLVARDFDTWEYRGALCSRWDVEDQLLLKESAAEKYGAAVQRIEDDGPQAGEGEGPEGARIRHVVYGRTAVTEDGILVEPVSSGSRLAEALEGSPSLLVAADDVEALIAGGVYTFYLRDGVLWHPSEGFEAHALDAADVVFSWGIHGNAAVDSDSKRFLFLKMIHAEAVGDRAVRFFMRRQDAFALPAFERMTILPAHLYDLSDPENPDHDPEATAEQQARAINENPHNQDWIGLGPYRVTSYDSQSVEAERFEGYHDHERGGYLDVLRWRVIRGDQAPFQAVLSGELDWLERVTSADYFGEATEQEEFTDSHYKGLFHVGIYSYVSWNLYDPKLEDVRVRRAFAHCFDFDEFMRTYFKGVVHQVTGPWPFYSPAYSAEVTPLPYDLRRAEELLSEAGWYDRDGDGVIDRDGVPLEIDLLMPAGNDPSLQFGLKFQENLSQVGVRLNIRAQEFSVVSEAVRNRSFEACNLAWVTSLEDDPEQLWHSRWGKREVRSSNRAGLQDPKVDELIERGQREVDFDKRQAVWHELHARLYELQPYLFMYNVPRKFAMNREIRGLQLFKVSPGYSVRRWYYPEGTPGTRPQRER